MNAGWTRYSESLVRNFESWCSKGVFFLAENINRQAQCLGGQIKVLVPGATIVRKNTIV